MLLNKPHKYTSILLVYCMFMMMFCLPPKASATPTPAIHYIPFVMTNVAFADIETHIQELIATYGPINSNSKNMYAFGVTGPFLQTMSIPDMVAAMNLTLNLAEQYNVPVFYQIDDLNGLPPYNSPVTAETLFSNDPTMVEWSSWPQGGASAGNVPNYWLPWSGWFTTGKTAAIGSPAFQNFMKTRLQQGVLAPLNAKLATWNATGKSYLFAGIDIGWETRVQDLTGQDPNNPPVSPVRTPNAPRNAVTVSSYANPTWIPNNAIDGNSDTGWSSAVHSSATGTEWISLDMGVTFNVDAVILKPRGVGFPVDFKLQYSTDGTTYTDIPGQSFTNFPQRPANTVIEFPFTHPVNARYIRLLATKLSLDDVSSGYYAQIMEFKAHVTDLSLAASSSTLNADWTASKAVDGNTGTGWTSVIYPDANHTDWLNMDLKSVKNVQQVQLISSSAGFPEDFKFQSSTDGVNFTDIPGQSYTGYPQPPNLSPVTFTFGSPINTRYLRVVTTKLKNDGAGQYYARIMEFKVTNVAAIGSSTVNSTWQSNNVLDGNLSTGWSSAVHATSSGTESLVLDLGFINDQIGIVKLAARGVCFPVDFKLQYSKDGTTYTDIPNQSYTNYPQPAANTVKIFSFAPIEARYIRLLATKLAHDGISGFYAQIMEMSAESGIAMLPQDMAQAGYHSISYLGYTQASFNAEAANRGISPQQLANEKLWQITHDYSQLLAKTVYDTGISKDKIFTHITGADSIRDYNSSTVPPIWAAVNPYSTPGFTMSQTAVPYNMTNLLQKIKQADPTQTTFANSEGYFAGYNTEAQGDAYLNEMFGNGATIVTVFGYGSEAVGSFYYVNQSPTYPFNKSIIRWLGNMATVATASASTTYAGYSAAKINDGINDTAVGTGSNSWTNDGVAAMPQWVQLDWGTNKTFSRVELYTSVGYEIKDYQIQYWNGTSWVDCFTAVTGNTSAHRTHTFTAVTGSKIRVLGNSGPTIQTNFVRVNELEVYSN